MKTAYKLFVVVVKISTGLKLDFNNVRKKLAVRSSVYGSIVAPIASWPKLVKSKITGYE